MVIRQTHGTCPYCNAVIKNYSLRAWFYGSPISTCKKCGNLYIDRRYHEMAVDGAAPDEFDVKKRNRKTSQSFVPRHNRFIGCQQPVKIVLNIQTVSTGSNCKGVYQGTCTCTVLCVRKQPVLPSHNKRPNSIFSSVVVYGNIRRFKKSVKIFLLIQSIRR